MRDIGEFKITWLAPYRGATDAIVKTTISQILVSHLIGQVASVKSQADAPNLHQRPRTESSLVSFLFFHFFVKFVDFLADFVAVFRVRVQIQIALVRLDGLFLQALFFLGFA
jgi:hypothetical protein